jgi:BirA family transcriptional regulator, biotin operon repressor / biotin---[acetyl-CoA-carboxylase] ligase
MARVQAGASLPFLLYADRQTSGRGRSGRVWEMQPGNLAVSYALALTCDHQTAAQLSFVAGGAIINALASYTDTLPTKPKLKWPNDIMIGDAKCGGILIETARDLQRGCLISVIGFGLNLVSNPEFSGRNLTNLTAHGCTIRPETIVAGLAVAMDFALRIWDRI